MYSTLTAASFAKDISGKEESKERGKAKDGGKHGFEKLRSSESKLACNVTRDC